jgi:urea transport system permease protein
MAGQMRLTCARIVAVLALLLAGQAHAAGLEELVQDLGGSGFAKKITAVEALGATGDAAVVPVLEALLEGKLYSVGDDNRVVVKTGTGFADPLTGAAVEPAPEGSKKLIINNKMRGVIRGALGGLTLLSKDAAVRLKAAQDVFTSRQTEALEALEKALAAETDSGVKSAMQRAFAALQLTASDKLEVKIAAIETLAEFSDPEVRDLLSSVLVANKADDASAEAQKLRAAAQTSLDKVDEHLVMLAVLTSLFQGVSLGSVLLLAAIGLAITFGVMGVINMAHGEMVMLGAYTTFVIQEQFRTYAPELFDLSLLVAIPAAFVVGGAFGIAIERCIIRFLYGRPLETLLATWGLSLILQQLVRSVFGPTNRAVGNPAWMSGAWEAAGGLSFTYNRICIIVFSILVIAALMALMRWTRFGLQMRAVTQNRAMAGSVGIRSGYIDALTFGLGSGIAGMAGVALSQIDNVSPNLGQGYIIDSFLVVVFGGVGNLWGTLIGALSLGVANKFLEPFAGAVLGKILILLAVILFIQKRPRGMFALKGRAVEA